MVNIEVSRKEGFLSGKESVKSQTHTFLPPVGGWISNAPLAAQAKQSAYVLDNFWPTAGGIEPRGGTDFRCSIKKKVTVLFEYGNKSGGVYFAADENNIYQFSSFVNDGLELSPVITGQTGGDYSIVELQTDGGIYLIAVNGENDALIYDGENWHRVNESSAPFAISAVDTRHLSCCWTYQNRIFFIQKGSMNAWYLPVNSIAGTAKKLPLAGLFTKGGSLLIGSRWATDSGNSLEDRCVFITDKGELAIFSGPNPSDANDWNLQGVYDVGEPLGLHSIMNIVGDLVIATQIGLVPLSAAVQKDPSQLKLHVASRAIDPEWRFETILSGRQTNWKVVKWDSRNMAIIAPEQESRGEASYSWVINLETGAWSRFSGWKISAIGVIGDELYYGDDEGKIYAADVGGTDDGQPFECKACFAFDHLGLPGVIKIAHMIRATWRYKVASSKAFYSIATDYKPKFLSTLSASRYPLVTGSGLWDTTDWDTDKWGNRFSENKIISEWENIVAHGTTIAPQIQLISSQSVKLDCELVTIELVYSTGGTLV